MEQFLRDRIPKGWKNRLFPKVSKIKPRKELTQEQKTKHYKNVVQSRRDKVIKIKTLFGGKCSVCGYSKNWSALELHHTDRKMKSFVVNTSTVANFKWNIIETEYKKCVLLCANCHQELHNPQLNIEQEKNITTLEKVFNA